jgi:hypothetical protein
MSHIADHVEIAALVARLGRVLDERQFDELRTIYTPDAESRSPRGELSGIDEIVEVLQRTSPEEEKTQHLNTNVVVDIDGDRAEVSASQLVYFFRADQAPHRTAGVQAAYTAVRTPNGWRFMRARISRLWQHAY